MTFSTVYIWQEMILFLFYSWIFLTAGVNLCPFLGFPSGPFVKFGFIKTLQIKACSKNEPFWNNKYSVGIFQQHSLTNVAAENRSGLSYSHKIYSCFPAATENQ